MTAFTTIFGAGLLMLVGHSLALERTTSGGGGEPCGERVCLKDKAECINGECVCVPPYVFGDGILNCYKKNEFRTEITNDPRIKTFNNHSIDLPVPCRYLLTHAVTEYKDQGRNVVGSCEMMIHAWHMKNHGKFYVGGYDLAIRVECNNGSRYEMSIRTYGDADNGNYNFYINGTAGSFVPNGPFQNHEINFHDSKTNLKIKTKMDEDNNLAIVEAKKCGFRTQFRTYDLTLKRQQGPIPGLSVGVNCAFHPEFESLDRVLALPPTWAHNGFTINDIEIPGLGKMGTMIYRAYMGGALQTQPVPNPECLAARDSLAACDSVVKIQTAFSNCLWILRSPRFIRCYDKSVNGIEIQGLFNTCVDIYCSGTATCQDVEGLIEAKQCETVPDYPDMTTFLNNCP